MSEEKKLVSRRKAEAPATEKPKAAPKTKTATTAKPKTESQAAPKARAKATAEKKPALKGGAKTEPKAALKRATKAGSAEKKPAVKSESKVKAVAKPRTEPKAKAVAKPRTEPKAKAVAKPRTEPKAKAAVKPKKQLKPTGAELAELVAAAAAEHKPIDPVLLDLSGRSSVADWFFVASADNPRQMEAIAEKIIRRARERGVRPLGQEGLGRGANCPWVLVDLGDVVVHIFNLEARGLYDLEGLWTDAPRHPVES